MLEAAELLPVDIDPPLGRHLFADQEADHRRLAGAARPNQEQKVLTGDVEIDRAQRLSPVGVGLVDVLKADEGRLRGIWHGPHIAFWQGLGL